MAIVVLGYGAVGQALTALLAARGDAVTAVQRHTPAQLPKGVRFMSADSANRAGLTSICAGARAVVNTIGIPYNADTWARVWPMIMDAVLGACAATGARHVFADNLYMYGPQTAPLREDMPLTTMGGKPGVRATITRQWQDAHARGAVLTAAVRASDFYGPRVATSVLAEFGVKRLMQGQPALVPYSPDHPHDFTYVPDFARALVSLIDAPDDAYGQAWHVPNAPIQTLRQHLQHAATLIGKPLKLTVLPPWSQGIVGLFNPAVGELVEMRFQTDRPYRVDASKFAARFWSDTTPFDAGLRATIEGYR